MTNEDSLSPDPNRHRLREFDSESLFHVRVVQSIPTGLESATHVRPESYMLHRVAFFTGG